MPNTAGYVRIAKQVNVKLRPRMERFVDAQPVVVFCVACWSAAAARVRPRGCDRQIDASWAEFLG